MDCMVYELMKRAKFALNRHFILLLISTFLLLMQFLQENSRIVTNVNAFGYVSLEELELPGTALDDKPRLRHGEFFKSAFRGP